MKKETIIVIVVAVIFGAIILWLALAKKNPQSASGIEKRLKELNTQQQELIKKTEAFERWQDSIEQKQKNVKSAIQKIDDKIKINNEKIIDYSHFSSYEIRKYFADSL